MSYQSKGVQTTNLYLAFYPEGEQIPPAQPAMGQESDRKDSLKGGLAGLYHDPKDQAGQLVQQQSPGVKVQRRGKSLSRLKGVALPNLYE